MLIKKTKIPLSHVALFAWMPSFLKTRVYRAKGYKIGPGVKIGIGSVVVGRDVEIGPETRIAPLTVITGDQVKIGPRVRIGALTVMNTKTIEIGEGTRINNMVVVGGLQSIRSAFRIGQNCILMEWSFINTTEPVVIGNNVGIGGHCLFFTHGLWPNTFEGYPAKFGPITIEDDAWLAWRVSVLPEVRIGHGCIISSDACVTKSFDEGNLIAGVPAKVIKGDYFYKKEMTDKSKIDLMSSLFDEFCELVKAGDISVQVEVDDNSTLANFSTPKTGNIRLNVLQSSTITDQALTASDCVVFVTGCAESTLAVLEAKKIPWLDVTSRKRSLHSSDLCNEYEDFLRKAGLRFLKYT